MKTKRMANGSLYLVLFEPASWEEFSTKATIIINQIGATINEKTDLVEGHIWKIEYKHRFYWVAYDDHQSSITLEPIGSIDDEIMLENARQIEFLI